MYFIIANVFSLAFFSSRNEALLYLFAETLFKTPQNFPGSSLLILQCQRRKGIPGILNFSWLKNTPLAGLAIEAQRKCSAVYNTCAGLLLKIFFV